MSEKAAARSMTPTTYRSVAGAAAAALVGGWCWSTVLILGSFLGDLLVVHLLSQTRQGTRL